MGGKFERDVVKGFLHQLILTERENSLCVYGGEARPNSFAVAEDKHIPHSAQNLGNRQYR